MSLASIFPQVWSTETHTLLFILNPHFDTDAGDIFSAAWSPSSSTLYFGCQNTSLQWFTFPPDSPDPQSAGNPLTHQQTLETALQAAGAANGASTPRRVHKFFDSYPQYTRKPADLDARNPSTPTPGVSTPTASGTCLLLPNNPAPRAIIQIPPQNVVWAAHYGYVYSMAISPSIREGSDDRPHGVNVPLRLVTGSGDATVKVLNRMRSHFFCTRTFYFYRFGTCLAVRPFYGILSNAGMVLSSLSSSAETPCMLAVRMATLRF